MKILIVMCLLFSSLSWANTDAKTKSDLTERGIRLVSQAQYPQAIEILKIESAKGDADAAFWLGIAYYKKGIALYKERERLNGGYGDNVFLQAAGDAFLLAAELGDPWAMSILSNKVIYYSSTVCSLFSWPCDNKWVDKALDRWDELAEQGDPDAVYVSTVFGFKWWEYFRSYTYPYLAALIERTISTGGGYGFMAGIALELEDSFKFFTMAANQGYAPAMLKLNIFRGKLLTDEEADKWVHRALNLGYIGAARTLYFKYSPNGKGRGKTKLEREKAYYYGTIYIESGGWKRIDSDILRSKLTDENGKRLYDEAGNQLYEEHFTEAERIEIEQRAKDFLKKVKPDAFLTKNTRELLKIYN